MPLWTKTANSASAGSEKPKWVPDEDKEDVYAKNSGYVHRRGGVYTDNHGNVRRKEEILVAARELAGTAKLANAYVSAVKFNQATMDVGAVGNISIFFNQEVLVTGVPTFTINAANTTANTVPSTLTCTYVKGSGNNDLVFNFTADANAATYSFPSTGVSLISNGAGVNIRDVSATSEFSDRTVSYIHSGANSTQGTCTAS